MTADLDALIDAVVDGWTRWGEGAYTRPLDRLAAELGCTGDELHDTIGRHYRGPIGIDPDGLPILSFTAFQEAVQAAVAERLS